MYEILVLPYCSVSFFLEGSTLVVPLSHNSPHDSSPLLHVPWQGWGCAVEWGHSSPDPPLLTPIRGPRPVLGPLEPTCKVGPSTSSVHQDAPSPHQL